MTAIRVTGALLALVFASACGGRHHLEQYNFSNRSIALVFIEAPSPELLHGWFSIRPSQNAVQNVVRAGAAVYKEIEARKAVTRFDAASRQVDFRDELARRTLERTSRYLGTRVAATPDSADYLLEINMRSFGLDARSNNSTDMFMRAEAVLIHRITGREIWREGIRARDQMTPWVYGGGVVPSAGISAIALSTVSVEDFRRALDQLVDFTSTLITNELREKLRDVRD
jgi:hypothetical protein